jgi:flagellar biosynthesis GTPase FlhF
MDIYTPLEALNLKNKNFKICNKIPKILLPIKNRNKNNSVLGSNSIKCKNEEDKDIKIDSVNKFKTEETKTEVGTKFSYYIANQCEIKALHSKQKIVHTESEVIKKNCTKQERNIKLAELFLKKLDIHSHIASKNFNLPLNIYKNDEVNYIQKVRPSEISILPFPKVSHINQLPIENNVTDKICNLLLKNDENLKRTSEVLQMKSILKLDNELHIPERVYKCMKVDIQATLFDIESYCLNTHALWNSVSNLTKFKYSNHAVKLKSTSNKKICEQLSQYNLKNELFHGLWIDKYKPNSSMEIVGNEEGAAKLKSWLNYWKFLKSNEDYSSSEEFYTSDFSMSYSTENSKVAVLIGPHGSGKTASVYAIANELGYR